MKFGIIEWVRDYFALTYEDTIIMGLPTGTKTQMKHISDWLNNLDEGSNGPRLRKCLVELRREKISEHT